MVQVAAGVQQAEIMSGENSESGSTKCIDDVEVMVRSDTDSARMKTSLGSNRSASIFFQHRTNRIFTYYCRRIPGEWLYTDNITKMVQQNI